MTKIFLLLNPDNTKDEINKVLVNQHYEIMESFGELEDTLVQIHHFYPDIIIIENSVENCEFKIRQIKSVANCQPPKRN